MPPTKDRIVETATRLAQTLGFNAFSYADIAEAVGIRKASIHHHFPAKTDLAAAMVVAYRAGFSAELARIDEIGTGSVERLTLYTQAYRASLVNERMCLCGMLASDASTLPEPTRLQVTAFFAENVTWLARTLDDGRRAGELDFAGVAADRAKLMLAAMQGVLLVARGMDDRAFFDTTVAELIGGLQPKP